MTLVERIIEAAASGILRRELINLGIGKSTVIDDTLQRLISEKRLFLGRVNGVPYRYFTAQVFADEWAACQKPIPSTKDQIRDVFEKNQKAGYSSSGMYPLISFASKRTVTAALLEMFNAGELVRTYHPVRKNRYFVCSDAAAEYANEPAPGKKPKVHKAATKATASRARSSRPVAVSKDTREVIYPPGLVVQVGPCAEVFSRYQLTSKDKVPALFSKLPLGATLYEMTA